MADRSTDRWCINPGCEWLALRDGWCSVHDPVGVGGALCSTGCGRAVYARAVCKACYQKLLREKKNLATSSVNDGR